jgi:hypothetical protein
MSSGNKTAYSIRAGKPIHSVQAVAQKAMQRIHFSDCFAPSQYKNRRRLQLM